MANRSIDTGRPIGGLRPPTVRRSSPTLRYPQDFRPVPRYAQLGEPTKTRTTALSDGANFLAVSGFIWSGALESMKAGQDGTHCGANDTMDCL